MDQVAAKAMARPKYLMLPSLCCLGTCSFSCFVPRQVPSQEATRLVIVAEAHLNYMLRPPYYILDELSFKYLNIHSSEKLNKLKPPFWELETLKPEYESNFP